MTLKTPHTHTHTHIHTQRRSDWIVDLYQLTEFRTTYKNPVLVTYTVIPHLGGGGRKIKEPKVILGHIVSVMPAWAR